MAICIDSAVYVKSCKDEFKCHLEILVHFSNFSTYKYVLKCLSIAYFFKNKISERLEHGNIPFHSQNRTGTGMELTTMLSSISILLFNNNVLNKIYTNIQHKRHVLSGKIHTICPFHTLHPPTHTEITVIIIKVMYFQQLLVL